MQTLFSLQNLEMYSINGIEIVLGTASIDHYVEDLAFAVHKIRNLENLVSFFALVRMDQRIQIIGRSDGKVLRTSGYRSSWKKAVVTLKEGFVIDLMSGGGE